MGRKFGCFLRFGFAASVVGTLLLAGATRLQAQGQYAPITEEDVLAMKLNHYYTPNKQFRERDFEWSFGKSEFVIKKGKGAIPADLLTKLVPAASSADEIRGQWKLEGGGLVLTEIKGGGKDGKKDVRLSIYRTAPIVIRVGEPQYVFGLGS